MLKPLRLLFTLIIAAAVLAAGCATDRLHKEGLQAIEAGQYEEGLKKLEQAVDASPTNLTYRGRANALPAVPARSTASVYT